MPARLQLDVLLWGQQITLQLHPDEVDRTCGWKAEPGFDKLIRSRLGDTLRRAAQGELSDWRRAPEGRPAEIIVLDQFSRNIHRGSPQAFAQDAMALTLAQKAVSENDHLALDSVVRADR